MDGRLLVQKACKALNESNLLLKTVSVEGILTADVADIPQYVHSFLDDIETVPSSKEHLLPPIVTQVYHRLADDDIDFGSLEELSITPEVDVELMETEFKRTI